MSEKSAIEEMYEFSPPREGTSSNKTSKSTEVSDLLDGFEVVASDSIPSITLDNQRRFYLNTSARRLMDVKPYQRISLAYHPEIKALAVIRPSSPGLTSQHLAELMTSVYSIDKRYYMSARHFSRNYGYSPEKAPYIFEYDRGSSDGSLFIFKLRV